MYKQKPLENLEGQKFGKLLVVGPSFRRDKLIRCPCICDCGIKTTPRVSTLFTGTSTSCGNCFGLINRIGAKYGLLTVKEKIVIDNKLFYKCLCDCGNERTESFEFFWGISKGKEKTRQKELACTQYCILLLYNNYEIIPDPAGAYVIFELTRGEWAKCDIGDWFTYLNKYKWYASLKSTDKSGEKRFYVNSGNKGE